MLNLSKKPASWTKRLLTQERNGWHPSARFWKSVLSINIQKRSLWGCGGRGLLRKHSSLVKLKTMLRRDQSRKSPRFPARKGRGLTRRGVVRLTHPPPCSNRHTGNARTKSHWNYYGTPSALGKRGAPPGIREVLFKTGEQRKFNVDVWEAGWCPAGVTVKLTLLDRAHSHHFPRSPQINPFNKKKKPNTHILGFFNDSKIMHSWKGGQLWRTQRTFGTSESPTSHL